MQDDGDVSGISPIHQARVNQDTIKRTVKDLDGVCEEIAAVIESLV